MLGNLSGFASPAIERLLKKLIADENNFNSEMRSLDREKLVLPIQLSTDDGREVQAFSRDVSEGGFGLITPQPFEQGDVAKAKVCFSDSAMEYLAECRWCAGFSDRYWTSGWQLKSGELEVDSIKSNEALMKWDVRTAEREKFAIPVVVHQKGKLPQFHAFTRNMSGEGVNLVSNERVPENSFCLLEFGRNDAEQCEIIAQCVWSKQYGSSHWLMGFQFPRLDRVAKFHAACFGR